MSVNMICSCIGALFLLCSTMNYLQYKLACFRVSFEIISVSVRDEIGRSCFLGAIVHLTHILKDDIIETLTSEVIVARLQTLHWGRHLHLFKYVTPEHLTKDRICAFVALLRSYDFAKHLIQHNCSCDVKELCWDHVVLLSKCKAKGHN